MSKHTPGPWRPLGKSVIFNEVNKINGRDSRQRQLAEIYTSNEADARLIAAAPEMHDMLLEVRAMLAGMHSAHDKEALLFGIARILAKAEGE